MVENHKLADTGVRIVHFSWSSDSQRVLVAWRDGLCNRLEQPILKAWNVGLGDEIPVDESLRTLLADEIRETYPEANGMTAKEALQWAISASDGLAWNRAHPEPFWACSWC